MTNLRKFILAAGVLVVAPSLAEAHVSAMHGSLSAGLVHPILGLDHLLAILAVGVAAAGVSNGRRWLLPALFLTSMLAGAIYGMAGLPLPHAELLIGLSLVAIGGLLVSGFPKVLGFIAIGLGGLVHGYAHGAELPAEAGGTAFMIGMLVTTAAIHAAGFGLATFLRPGRGGVSRFVVPGFGAVVGISGASLMLMGL